VQPPPRSWRLSSACIPDREPLGVRLHVHHRGPATLEPDLAVARGSVRPESFSGATRAPLAWSPPHVLELLRQELEDEEEPVCASAVRDRTRRTPCEERSQIASGAHELSRNDLLTARSLAEHPLCNDC